MCTPTNWHLKLFSKSVLKQAKLRQLTSLLPADLAGKTCLDLGSDNGVISYYLRELGGTWHSADLSEETVISIRSLVGERVEQINGRHFPYEDNTFDLVLVVDMLEHVKNDKLFITELHRILKKDAVLIINAPNLKRFSPLRLLRNLIGQTDEAHGHLRPGYGLLELHGLLENDFFVESSHTYSRFFSEFIDTCIVFAYGLIAGKKGAKKEGGVSKGLVVTEADLKKYEKNFKLYSMIYPVVSAVSKLDRLIFFVPGFMRITRVVAKK